MNLRIAFILFIFLSSLSAQVTGLLEDFDDQVLDGWEVPGVAIRTYELVAVTGTMKIDYHRVSSSWEWDNFNYTPPQKIDATGNRYITLRVKSNIITELTLKPIYDNGANDWLQVMLPSDDEWHTYKFELLAPSPLVMNRIYFYLDGGSTNPKSGVVYFDDLRIADSVRTADLLDNRELERALNAAHALYDNSSEGGDEGQFASGSKQELWNAILQAEAVLNQAEVTQEEIDQATWDLYDACSVFETRVNGPHLPLVDVKATLQTRYLYLNLDYLKDKGILFGMHDATGYGVGWSGDDDRSDIKDVCGDYPAFYSEELYKVTRNLETERVRYRMSSAYRRGGVLSMCWHQYDPQGRGFYAADVGGENVVGTILPGGIYHQQYKEKLKKVALFFKSLRGEKGEAIPVIFRPYHEHNGSWFWWGKGQCTKQQYVDLWQFTVNFLRDTLNVHNLLYALSPSMVQSNWGTDYKEIFPGQDYVDVYGVDHYFGDVITATDKERFRSGLRRVADQALYDLKLPALTEVGQEGLDTVDFFTNVLLWALTSDSLNNFYSYAAVWRNQDANHHFAPYPGHPVVPDFLKFYDDPYTFFESDLPAMYKRLQADTLPPFFVEAPTSPFVATDTLFFIALKTNEKALLKYDFVDLPYDSMHFEFEEGQSRLEHRTTLKGKQGEIFDLFIRARDLFGNVMDSSLVVRVEIDTLQRPIYWYDKRYDYSTWPVGQAPFVFEGETDGNTQVRYSRTVYYRKEFNMSDVQNVAMLAAIVNFDNGLAIYLNGHEVARENLEDGVLGYKTWATENFYGTKQIILDEQDVQYLQNGSNVLAVEVHQAMDDSSDLKFDLKLITANYQVLIDYQQEWAYFAQQRAPEVQVLGAQAIDKKIMNPSRFALFQNYPNPFNGQTTIAYYLPESGQVDIFIYNLLGQVVWRVRAGKQSRGFHQIKVDLNNLSSGIYFYRLNFGNKTKIRKCVLIK